MDMAVEIPSAVHSGNWHVVLAHPREESRAAAGLIAHRIRVYLPHVRKRRLFKHRMVDRLEPMFPTYLFIPAEPDIPWGDIRATPGVRYSGFQGEGLPALMSDGKPGCVPAAAMQIVMAKEAKLYKGVERPPEALKVGREVEAVDGPFQWFKGVIENIEKLDTHGRLSVGLDIFGRLTSVSFEVSQVRAV